MRTATYVQCIYVQCIYVLFWVCGDICCVGTLRIVRSYIVDMVDKNAYSTVVEWAAQPN